MTAAAILDRDPLRRGRMAEQIIDDLRERILGGSLVRGAKLPTERELAQAYGVSGATVREAMRALAAAHMIEVRHGSGAYVTADAEQLIAQSLHSMIQIERIGARDILGVLAALNVYGAELAARVPWWRPSPRATRGRRARGRWLCTSAPHKSSTH